MTALTLGFIPLTDCAPLAVAQARGLFADEGLEVALRREASWATIRDKVAVGALDGAHMLAPMALAAAVETGGAAPPMLAPLAMAANGAGVTLSNRIVDALTPEDWSPRAVSRALSRLIAERRASGEAPLTFAVVFPFSMHNYMLRYWLADAGIDPDRDVRLVVVPPPRMVDQLLVGLVDGVCVGAPWNAVAVREGLGRTVLRTSQFWPEGPDKVLGVSAAFARGEPAQLQALLRAVVRAQAWCDEPGNRNELATLLAQPAYVGAAPEAIAVALSDELVFHRNGAAVPRVAHARWLLSQMERWKQIGGDVDQQAVAAAVYRPDLTLAALQACDLAPASLPAPGLLFDSETTSLSPNA
jgi:NitT/TauT family transport system ATP-binding protein/nitrate/nitrite transport system substrate-binding protein